MPNILLLQQFFVHEPEQRRMFSKNMGHSMNILVFSTSTYFIIVIKLVFELRDLLYRD